MTQPEALSEQEAAHIYRLRDCIMQQENEMYLLRQQIKRLSWDSIHTCHAECQRPVCRMTRERDALLEALKEVVAFTGAHGGPYVRARAVIAKVEEGEQA